MKSIYGIGLTAVRSVYASPQGDFWELLLGQQLHIGGMKSSMELAELLESAKDSVVSTSVAAAVQA